MAGFNYKNKDVHALIKFSEKQKAFIVYVNKLFHKDPETVYSTCITFNSIDSETCAFLEDNGFRINAHKTIKNGDIAKYENDDVPQDRISETYINTNIEYNIFTYNKDIDAIYTLSFDTLHTGENFIPKDFFINIDIYSNKNQKERYLILVKIVTDALKTDNLYSQQANIIGDDMGSFMVLRTNPKLTGNIKLVITEDYNLYLDTFKVSSASILNERKYRRQSVAANGNYVHDVKTIFSDLPKGVLYNVHSDSYMPHKNYYDINIQLENTYEYGAENNYDSLYTENMKILAPLYIGKKLPDYFCIFRTDNIVNQETYNNTKIDDISKFYSALKNPHIVKIFDLHNSTTIGQYLKNYASLINQEISGACHLQFLEQNFRKVTDENYRQGRNTWYGIDINKGILTKKVETSYYSSKILENAEQRQEKYNMFILNGFERNNLLYPNIINLEFMFNDEDAGNMSMHNYFGLYLTENQFIKFNSITLSSETNSQISYYDSNDNELNPGDINFDVIENDEYADRIFFMTTPTDAAYVNNILDINTFIKNHVNNVPGKNICNIKSELKELDDINNFIVMKFTKPIQYGEHFKFVFMHNYANTDTLVFELIASNDHRLRYTKNNISPYISTNTPDDVTKDINRFTQIFRMSFYTQDLSDPMKTASLNEQLERIQACIRKLEGSNIFVGNINSDTISFMITYGENDIAYNDVYFEHILADDNNTDYIRYYNFNNITATHLLLDNNDLFPDNLIGFANNGLELTGERKYTITRFINTYDIKKYFIYQLDFDLYKELKNITIPLVNTVKGYYPLIKFNISHNNIDYISPDTAYIFDTNNKLQNYIRDLNKTSVDEYTIISPFNVSTSIVISPYKARLINNYINICAPKTAALSLMGINNIMDIDTWVNNEENIPYNSAERIFIQKGKKMYIYTDIKPNKTYKLLSGNIRNIPAGNNVTFCIFNNSLVYTYNGEIYTTDITNDYLLADEDTVLTLYDNSFIDTYSYSSIIKQLDTNNYYKYPQNKSKSDLIIPVVPTVNCNWKSNGVYFDHNSVLNTDYQTYEYIDNIVGHFTENVYMPVHDNDNQYIITSIDDHILDNGKNISIKDFILNNHYKYPLKKFLLNNVNIETAIGYYNKYIQTLEFIFYGIKFIISFTNNEYTRNIKLEEYNNYQIFILNDYDGSSANELFISKKEQLILLINHIYHIKDITTNDSIINTQSNYKPVSYNWYNAPYNYDMSNCARLDNKYIFKKTGSTNLQDNTEYFIENDLDVYDDDFNIVYNECPYYSYIKTDNTFQSYQKNDRITHVVDNPTIMTLMSANEKYKNFFSVSPLDDTYTDYKWDIVITGEDQQDIHGIPYIEYIRTEKMVEISENKNNLYEFFNNYDISFRQKNSYILLNNELGKHEYSNRDKLNLYKESIENQDLDVYVIRENGTYSYIAINDNYRPINISLNISHTKFNHGIFNPAFKKIFEFSNNDEISGVIDMDCLLANTHVSKINSIKNYTCNKIVKTGSYVTNNFFILPTKEMFTSCWDNNIYRLYNNDTNFDVISGYITGIEDKTLFGSKCLVLHDNNIVIQKYDYDRDNVQESIQLSDYNENATAQNTYSIRINLTKIFYNNIINSKDFYNNWTFNINDMTKSQNAMNNYILNTLKKFFNMNSGFTLHMYRKYDINKLDSNNAFIYDMPDDFSDYEEYMNYTTDYQISDNELNISINIPEYNNYYYYLIIKINRY